jgi:hypothetical protein
MATKRNTKAVKRGKKVKDLSVKGMTARQAKGVRGGKGGFEIPDFQWGIGRGIATGGTGGGGAGEGKDPSVGEIKIKP